MEFQTRHRRIIIIMSLVCSCGLMEAAVQSACQLYNGQCRYQVRIMSECDQNIQNSPQDRTELHTSGAPNAIEKYLLQAKSEHAKKLTELENKIASFSTVSKSENDESTLLKSDDLNSEYRTTKTRTKETSQSKKKTRSRNETGFKKDPQRRENHLLNRVHAEFTRLRDELSDFTGQLAVTRKSLQHTEQRLNESLAENKKLSHQLRHTESKLEEEQASTYRLNKQLENTASELNETQSKLTESQSELRRSKVDNWKLRSANSDCEKQLEQCLQDKDLLKRALDQALVRYHDLNVKHDNMSVELERSQDELITCYRGKTTQYCGFEDASVCGFTRGEDSSEGLSWVRWNSETPSALTGPKQDHTCLNKQGFYMYLEATKRAAGDIASLISPRYYGNDEQCIEFYYHMYGYHIGTLKVYTMVPRQEAVPMWRAFGNQGDAWSSARIPVPLAEARRGYQVVFQATIGNGNEGDIAIDDFRIFDGPCYVATDSAATKREENNDTN